MGYLDENGLRYLWSKVTGRSLPIRAVSKADYEALPEEEKNADVVYIVPDGGGPGGDGGAGGNIPAGGIIIWSGAADAVPEGWALCDGTNGTPDLRDRFVLGAGSKYGVGAKGGEEAVTLTVDQMPKHDHVETERGVNDGTPIYPKLMTFGTPIPSSYTIKNYGAKKFSYAAYGKNDLITSSDGIILMQSDSANDHPYHSMSGNNQAYAMKTYQTGGGTAHNNMPPYYALCYIMKL